MLDGLLNWWVSDLVAVIDLYGKMVGGNDEADDCGGRERDWFGERISSMCFVFMVTEVDGEIR